MSNISITQAFRVTCSGGSAGSSAGETDSTYQLFGEVIGFVVKYSANPASTIDTQIDTLGADGMPTYQLLKLSNNVTDGLFLSRKQVVDINGAALLYSTSNPVAEKIPVLDKLKMTLAQGNSGDYVDIWCIYKASN